MRPTTVKGIRSFLGHAEFYKRFITDFSKIARPLCKLLEKEAKFEFDDACKSAFEDIRARLIIAPIMATPDLNKNFEIMYDASDYAMGAILRQRTEKIFRAIYYASKTFNEAQENCSTTEKEMLAMVFACEKFKTIYTGISCHNTHKSCSNQVPNGKERCQTKTNKMCLFTARV